MTLPAMSRHYANLEELSRLKASRNLHLFKANRNKSSVEGIERVNVKDFDLIEITICQFTLIKVKLKNDNQWIIYNRFG